MLRPARHVRYHIAGILAAHWIQFVSQYRRWIRPVVFGNVRKVLACPPSLSLRRGGREGEAIPDSYKNIHGEIVKIDPETLDPNTEVMRF